MGGRDPTLVQEDSNLRGDASPKASARGAKGNEPKKVIAKRVLGSVVWFSMRKGYGFINRHNTQGDVFVYYTAITWKNPHKYQGSVDDGETVELDMVQGEGVTEAGNMTRPARATEGKMLHGPLQQ